MDGSRRIAIAIAIAAACGAALLGSLGFVAGGAPFGADASAHIAEAARVAELISDARTDFWFDGTNLGYPLFLAHAPGATLITGTFAAAAGGPGSAMFLVKLSVVLLWAVMPVAWYFGGRRLGMSQLEAAIFGLLSIAVRDRIGIGVSLASIAESGLYAQAWGMALLPLAIGSVHRYLSGRADERRGPALWIAGVVLCHAFTGYYVALAAAVVVLLWRDGIRRRAGQLAGVLGIVLALVAFWWIPMALQADYRAGPTWDSELFNGYPAAQLVKWLMGGELFDHGRFPWLTIAVIAGAVVSIRNWARPLDRWTLCLLGVTFALFLGRATWGVGYALVPFHGDVDVARYLIGVHFCGLILAALAIARGIRFAAEQIERAKLPPWLTAERAIAAPLVIAGALYLLSVYRASDEQLRTFDLAGDGFLETAQRLSRDRSGRFAAHPKLSTAPPVYLDLMPYLAARPALLSYARGRRDTLSQYYVDNFDFAASSFRLYNVRAAVSRGPVNIEGAPLREAWAAGPHRVSEIDSRFGYFDFVRTPVSLAGDPWTVRWAAGDLVRPLFEIGVLPRFGGGKQRIAARDDGVLELYLDGDRVLETSTPAELVSAIEAKFGRRAIASRVLQTWTAPNEFRATVHARGKGERLLLKASYHPYWHASVDGEAVDIDHVAPNLMAVDLTAGAHEVRFRYKNPVYQKLLFLAALLGVLLWGTGLYRRLRRS